MSGLISSGTLNNSQTTKTKINQNKIIPLVFMALYGLSTNSWTESNWLLSTSKWLKSGSVNRKSSPTWAWNSLRDKFPSSIKSKKREMTSFLYANLSIILQKDNRIPLVSLCLNRVTSSTYSSRLSLGFTSRLKNPESTSCWISWVFKCWLKMILLI